ncbi:DUF1214 domain-containing protein [Vibrio ishigakensis]|nr:DUF1214 domain-containing protein [Vibrio ishigakensis]
MKLHTIATAITATLLSTSVLAKVYEADVPQSIITPDSVESIYVGDLEYKDGVPTQETIQKAEDFADVATAFRVFKSGIPVASIQGLLTGHERIGIEPNRTIGISDNLLNAHSIWLTANTTTPYVTGEIDVKNGPVVLNIGTPLLGLLDDAAFKFVGNIGVTNPEDQGTGGKYFIYHTSYKGELPEGYIHIETKGYQHWLLARVITTPENLDKDVQALKDTITLHPYGEKPNTNFINMTDVKYNTVHAMNHEFYDEINTLIQYEPTEVFDPEWLSMAQAIGIEKGKEFNPDERMQRILEEAAKIATADIRSAYHDPNKTRPRWDDRNYFTPLVDGHEFKNENGVIHEENRAIFHFMATGITPAMKTTTAGRGSDYLVGARDINGDSLDGNKTYKVIIPSMKIAEKFWSFMIYDNQTRSMLETEQRKAGVDGLQKGLRVNKDGTTTIYFSAEAPKGWENNWVQTREGKGFNILFRTYSPTQEWLDDDPRARITDFIPVDPETEFK